MNRFFIHLLKKTVGCTFFEPGSVQGPGDTEEFPGATSALAVVLVHL